MESGEIVDWIFKACMAGLVALWGVNQKRADEQAALQRRLADHDRRALEAILLSKAVALEDLVAAKAHGLDRLLESMFAQRDQQIASVQTQIERGHNQKAHEMTTPKMRSTMKTTASTRSATMLRETVNHRNAAMPLSS